MNTPSVSLYNDHRKHPTYSAEEHWDEIQNVNGGNAVHRENMNQQNGGMEGGKMSVVVSEC